MKKRLFSVAVFPAGARRLGAVLCVIFFAQFLWAPLEARGLAARSQVQEGKASSATQSQPPSRGFALKGTARETVEITVTTPGRIEANAVWTGSAGRLALILNGPGRVGYYARQDGPSPLTLSFDITAALLAKGATWRVSVANNQPNATANGTLRIVLPKAGAASASSGGKAPDRTATKPADRTAVKPVDNTAVKPSAKPTVKPTTRPAVVGPKAATVSLAPTEAERIAAIRGKLEAAIPQAVQSAPLSKVLIPLLFQKLAEIADSPSAIRYYYKLSRKRKTQTEQDLALHFQRAVGAYQTLTPAFKSRYFDPALVNLKKGQKADPKRLADSVIRSVKPAFETEVRQIFRLSFAPERLKLSSAAVRAAKPASDALSVRRATLRSTRAGASSSAQAQRIGSILSAGARSGALSTAEKSELQTALESLGYSTVPQTTMHPVYQEVADIAAAGKDLSYLNGKRSAVDYYRQMVTLDWFHCDNRQETTKDEAYFALTTVLPQFDPADPAYFSSLKDGCLNRVYGSTTRTYENVAKGSDRGLRGDDRVLFDYITFNSPFAFTVDLWEEDFSKGSVADALEEAVRDIANQIIRELSAAVKAKLISLLKDAAWSAFPGLSQSAMFSLIDALVGTDLSFASFENLLHNLFAGRAIDPTWYVLYFMFNGGDLLETLALIGGGSTVVGWILLGFAVVGPTLSDLLGGLHSGDFGQALVSFFKILTVVPLIVDFFMTVLKSVLGFFEWCLSIIDPDDHIGSKRILVERVSTDWQYDAQDGEWTKAKLGGAVDVKGAEAVFARTGYGPTRENSSLISGAQYWIPMINFQRWTTYRPPGASPTTRVTTEYRAFYEVFREVAGGRTTLGYYLPDEGWAYKEVPYKGKSSPAAWWDNIIQLQVMSINTVEFPLVCIRENSTGRSACNACGETVIEMPVVPGASYTIQLLKMPGGEMGGYITIYEGPRIRVNCPERTSGGAAGGPTSSPPKYLR